ncbi:MAG: hypothetical protein SGPRY_005102 [Prymnesium sp.]
MPPAPLHPILDKLRAVYTAVDNLHEQRDAMIECNSWRCGIRKGASQEAERGKLGKQDRERLREGEKERLDAIVAQRQNMAPCDYCGNLSSIVCMLCGVRHLHHFCQNEKVPVFQSSIEYHLCQTCAKDEVPILAQMNTDSVDKPLSDLDVHDNFRNLPAKKNFLAARCDCGEDRRAEGDAV